MKQIVHTDKTNFDIGSAHAANTQFYKYICHARARRLHYNDTNGTRARACNTLLTYEPHQKHTFIVAHTKNTTNTDTKQTHKHTLKHSLANRSRRAAAVVYVTHPKRVLSIRKMCVNDINNTRFQGKLRNRVDANEVRLVDA